MHARPQNNVTARFVSNFSFPEKVLTERPTANQNSTFRHHLFHSCKTRISFATRYNATRYASRYASWRGKSWSHCPVGMRNPLYNEWRCKALVPFEYSSIIIGLPLESTQGKPRSPTQVPLFWFSPLRGLDLPTDLGITITAPRSSVLKSLI
jgi:hypothetical protein